MQHHTMNSNIFYQDILTIPRGFTDFLRLAYYIFRNRTSVLEIKHSILPRTLICFNFVVVQLVIKQENEQSKMLGKQ